MTRLAKTGSREYRSELRTQQAEETRERILDATVRVSARGIATLSIPTVAAEASVSVPTVYRHFGTKTDLLAAVYPHVLRRAGIRDQIMPKTLAELRERSIEIFGQIDAFDDLTRAAMASPASAEVRRLSIPRRFELFRTLVDTSAPDLHGEDRDRVVRLLIILTSSSALRTWRDVIGSSVEQAADDLDWFVQAAIAAARRNDT
jgi:AcrR family transcriptional regulator